MLSHFSLVQLLATLWTLARQAPLSMEYSRQEYWNGLPFPPPEDLPDPGVQPTLFLCFPHWQASSLPPAPSRKHWMPSKTFPQASGAPHPQNPPTGRGHPNIPCSSPTHPSSLLSVQLPSGSKRELWPKASEQAKKASPKLQARKRQQAWTTAPPWEKQNGGCQHTSWCSVGLRRNTCLRILPR